MLFREAFPIEKGKFFVCQGKPSLTLIIWYPPFREYRAPFTKLEETMEQLAHIPHDTLPPTVTYGLLYEHLPSLCLREKGRG